MMRSVRKNRVGTTTLVATVGLGMLLAASPVFAGLGASIVPDIGGGPEIEVGTTCDDCTLTLENAATGTDQGKAILGHTIIYSPACEVALPNPCPGANADTGVFSVAGVPPAASGTATGVGGQAGCEGTWTIKEGPNFATNGELQFEPPSTFCNGGPNDGNSCTGDGECTPGVCEPAVILGPVTNSTTRRCVVTYTVEVSGEVTKDANPTEPGGQTRVLALYNVHFVGEPAGDTPQTGNDPVTVVTPVPTETPTNTPTETSTPTNTPTPTDTPTRTPTSPPVPVVPTPASPAGLLLIGGLALAIAFMLARRSMGSKA